ncbi:hypothetical protein PRUB_b0788 [Pseudoalteromonas rubra]|uniref:Uncharacterized protein n=1 Tax=Pseudoalteromonas rubra TaxID=43658 RepID=A0A8T0C0X1_9GAMM|nr:hypothetical protein [Pseudoalteromonas rubra]KAF7781536.1 hypothetical protein PRUB_b0788 [Pseudoalteromonas rubra]
MKILIKQLTKHIYGGSHVRSPDLPQQARVMQLPADAEVLEKKPG